MALKTSNKNRKKVQQEKIQKIQLEHAEFTKKFTRYYVAVFAVLVILSFIL